MDMSLARARAASRTRVRRLASAASFPGQALLQIVIVPVVMQSAGGATASITLRSSGIQGSGVSCARLSWLPHVRD
jgi:hypothetical protein